MSSPSGAGATHEMEILAWLRNPGEITLLLHRFHQLIEDDEL